MTPRALAPTDGQSGWWCVRGDDDTMPRFTGEWCLWHDQPRPPHGVRDEIFLVDPNGSLLALIPEVHHWTIDDDLTLTVTPSVVSHSGWHGFIHASHMS